MNDKIDYLCDLIVASKDSERQAILVKELEIALSGANLETRNRVTYFIQQILKREFPAA
jgi:hypothetical protein